MCPAKCQPSPPLPSPPLPEDWNDLILCCRNLIREKLVADFKESKHHTNFFDEATDCFLKEQIALVFRFADMSSSITEELLSFLECSDVLCAQSLLKTIKEFLDGNVIDISDCRGQGYDDLGAVAGKNQSLALHGLWINSEALYTHCSCHTFNLEVVGSCGEQRIRNPITILRKSLIFSTCLYHETIVWRRKYCSSVQILQNISLRMSAEPDGWKG